MKYLDGHFAGSRGNKITVLKLNLSKIRICNRHLPPNGEVVELSRRAVVTVKYRHQIQEFRM